MGTVSSVGKKGKDDDKSTDCAVTNARGNEERISILTLLME